MKKKVLSVLLVAAMTASMFAGCGSSAAEETEAAATEAAAAETEAFDYGSGTITIWVADAVVDFTKTEAEKFITEKGVDYTIDVQPVGEGDAATNVITDVEAAADIYGFAQDQTARLVSAGALQTLTGTGFDSWIAEQNDSGAVAAATVGDNIVAFPITSDNGYFLYYDKTVVTDPTSLEQIIADCENANKKFDFDLSAWYDVAFFFATGCTATFDTDVDGNFTAMNMDYATNPAGLVALKEIADMAASSAWVSNSSVSAADAATLGAIVDGTWDYTAAQEVFGDNLGCAELPSFVGSDGTTYHMASFSGNKLLGVKPQTEAGKLKLCLELAQYLSSEEVQEGRFDAVQWGPSNIAAQSYDAVVAAPQLAALAAQNAYATPQGQYPSSYWKLGDALAGDANTLAGKSDDELTAYLQSLVDIAGADLQ